MLTFRTRARHSPKTGFEEITHHGEGVGQCSHSHLPFPANFLVRPYQAIFVVFFFAVVLDFSTRALRKHGFSKWIILDRFGGRIGDSGLLKLEEHGWIDLGFRLAPSYWGQGLATEAASAWVRAAFDDLHIDPYGQESQTH